MSARAGHRHGTLVLVAVSLVAAEGLVAARLGFAAFEWRQAVLTLLTGWVIAGCGAVAWRQVPASRTGPLLLAAAAAWYLGSFEQLGAALVAMAAAALASLYVAILGHAILTVPRGRIGDGLTGVVVLMLYVLAVLPIPGRPVLLAVTLVMGLGVRRFGTSSRPADGSRLAGLLLATGLVIGPLMHGLAGGRIDASAALPVAASIAAMVLVAGILGTAATGARMTEVVLEVDHSFGRGLAGDLATALGDPTVEVGTWLPHEGRYADAEGRTVDLPPPGTGRMVTTVERDGRPVAIVIHGRGLGLDATLRSAMARAAELAAVNERLRAEVRAQVAAVQASRLRLVTAADEERLALRQRLHDGVAMHLDALAALLEPPGQDQLVEVRRELERLSDGLHPGVLDARGLGGALAELASHSGVPVEVRTAARSRIPRIMEVTLYFVCSEALANVAKHAHATHATVALDEAPGQVVLEVRDDGIGGADPAAGTGLIGLRDRVEAMDGTLRVQSGPGGTRLTASLPLVRQA